MKIDDPATVTEVAAAFARYERALGENDTEALDSFFWPSEKTVRLGVGEQLYGIEAIRAFRTARAGGSPVRALAETRIMTFGADFAVTSTEFIRTGEARRGRQMQTWVRLPELGWRIVAAHVSLGAGIS